MASIYNEKMMYLYDKGELYKSNRSSFGKCGFWSKNCSYGYAHYNPKTKEFAETLGWKGIQQLRKKFGVCMQEDDYLKFMKYYKLKYDWVYTLCKTDLRRFYKRILPYVMLVKV